MESLESLAGAVFALIALFTLGAASYGLKRIEASESKRMRVGAGVCVIESKLAPAATEVSDTEAEHVRVAA